MTSLRAEVDLIPAMSGRQPRAYSALTTPFAARKPLPIDQRGINAIAPGLEIGVHERKRCVLRQTDPKGQGAEPNDRWVKIRVWNGAISHWRKLLVAS